MTVYACWIRGCDNAADRFLRLGRNNLRPVCSDCLNIFLSWQGVCVISFEEGFEEWVVQEVQTT